jgi:hypothetical protein
MQESKRSLEYYEDIIDEFKSIDQKSNFRFISERILKGQLQVLFLSSLFLFKAD